MVSDAETVVCVDITGKEFRVPVSELHWRPSAYGIVIKDGAVLLSKQFNGYDLPGDGLDLGETPEQAVLREVNEETGILVANPELLTVETSFFKQTHKKNGLAIQSLQMYYSCSLKGGALTTEGFDEDEKNYAEMPEWFPIAQLDGIVVANSYDWRPLVMQALQENINEGDTT